MRNLRLFRLVRKGLLALAILLLVFFVGRIYQSEQGPPLQQWHSWSADEMTADEIDKASFADYQRRETRIFQQMKVELNDELSEDEKGALNRFYPGSAIYPARFQPDWNRSFILLPTGAVRGAVGLLHGLTDSRYSVRYLAEAYRQQGFAGLAGWPALFPAFARTAWLNMVPEYNPFKYNSFPVNAVRQSWLLTQAAFPSVLTFQSVLYATVSTPAIVSAVYRYPAAEKASLITGRNLLNRPSVFPDS
ncbi:membrane protein|nr:membrane protein [Candidatus Pantoea persica]